MWVVVAVLAVLIFFVISIYNRLVALRQRFKNSFADIDVQLKMRYDLVPNLIETVKGYATHEKGVLENVTTARANAMRGGSPAERAGAEQALTAALANLYAVSENYPDLKANTNFIELQNQLSDIEAKIAAARRFYNNSISEYNTAIEQFPANLIANKFGFTSSEFFELDESKRGQIEEAPKVSFGG